MRSTLSPAPVLTPARRRSWRRRCRRLRGGYDSIGARLSIRGGEVLEGPFIETKDAIGGIFVVDAESLEEATALARQSPVLHLQNGYVEVRSVER